MVTVLIVCGDLLNVCYTRLNINAPGMTRTCGLWIRNPSLYPPELRGLDRNDYLLVVLLSSFI